MNVSRSGDFADLATNEHPTPDERRIARLKQRASTLVANNQQACYPACVKRPGRWRCFKREPQQWACISIARSTHSRDLFISPDGRIGTGQRYPDHIGTTVAHIREDTSLWHQSGMETAIDRLANELPNQLRPTRCSG